MVMQIESRSVLSEGDEEEMLIREFFEGLGDDEAINIAMNSGKEWTLRTQSEVQAKTGVFVVGLAYMGEATPITMAMNKHWVPEAPRIRIMDNERIVGIGTIRLVMPYVDRYLQEI